MVSFALILLIWSTLISDSLIKSQACVHENLGRNVYLESSTKMIHRNTVKITKTGD